MSSEINSKSKPLPSQTTKPNTSSTTEMLTPTELASLRQETNELIDYGLAVYRKKMAARKAKSGE